MTIVALLYVFVNAAYFFVLTPDEWRALGYVVGGNGDDVTHCRGVGVRTHGRRSGRVDLQRAPGRALVGARVPYAMASDGLFFRSLARVSARTAVPVRALLAQGT